MPQSWESDNTKEKAAILLNQLIEGITDLLIAWNRVLLEKLTGSQLV
jgi:hypothetical protein